MSAAERRICYIFFFLQASLEKSRIFKQPRILLSNYESASLRNLDINILMISGIDLARDFFLSALRDISL